MYQNDLEFGDDNRHTGFRLKKFELLNWGTFDHQVWNITVDGNNSLLTGDIGSGKSTIVDAITTLLVPYHKITFNKAAGADKKERSLYSYIRGEYKNQKETDSQSSRSIYLRDEKSYSVLLAHFFNEGYNSHVTLATVFWIKENNVEKFFVIANRDLNIVENFSRFGNDISLLKRQLKQDSQIEIFTNFKDYNLKFRHLFGIKSEKALDLFYQTVSMKSVGNLTSFVRNQMLEKTNVEELIQDLKQNFENLTRAHNAVIKAKKQKEQLAPMIQLAGEYEKDNLALEQLKRMQEALPSFFADKKYGLLAEEIEKLKISIDLLSNRSQSIRKEFEEYQDKKLQLNLAIESNKEGQRLRELENELKRLDGIKQEKIIQAENYNQLALTLSFSTNPDESKFYKSLNACDTEKKQLNQHLEEIILQRDNQVIHLDQLKKAKTEIEAEIISLKNRKSSISSKNLEIRAILARYLNVAEEELPFAGELLRVKDEEAEWEGAIERILHNFALSMLVPDHLYKRAANYVNKTDLKGRLVYYRISSDISKNKVQIFPNSLIHKIVIKNDTPFYDWLEHELSDKFNYACCDSIEEFYRQTYAVTREGQVKGGRYKHEKDDRTNIFDRKNYILGWQNIKKIKALETEHRLLSDQYYDVEQEITRIDKEKKSLEKKTGIWKNSAVLRIFSGSTGRLKPWRSSP